MLLKQDQPEKPMATEVESLPNVESSIPPATNGYNEEQVSLCPYQNHEYAEKEHQEATTESVKYTDSATTHMEMPYEAELVHTSTAAHSSLPTTPKAFTGSQGNFSRYASWILLCLIIVI